MSRNPSALFSFSIRLQLYVNEMNTYPWFRLSCTREGCCGGHVCSVVGSDYQKQNSNHPTVVTFSYGGSPTSTQIHGSLYPGIIYFLRLFTEKILTQNTKATNTRYLSLQQVLSLALLQHHPLSSSLPSY